MNVWRLRLLLIGAINAIIGIVVGISRGYSIAIIVYIAVSLVVCLIGVIWKPKERKKSILSTEIENLENKTK